MVLKTLQELSQKFLKKTNKSFEITNHSSPVRGMFDGRTDLTG